MFGGMLTDPYAFIEKLLVDCQPTVDQDVNGVSIEYQPRGVNGVSIEGIEVLIDSQPQMPLVHMILTIFTFGNK